MVDILKTAWEKYLEDGDSATLLLAINAYGRALPDDCEYPYAHRIRDIAIGTDFYRVVRIADEFETIYIIPCSTPSVDEEGVPYWLQGAQLQRWVKLASEEVDDDDDPEYFQLDTKTDWNLFR